MPAKKYLSTMPPMDSTIEFLLPGMAIGIVAALSPGPVMALLVSETMRYGIGGGLRVAVVPIVTDIPVAAVAFLIAKEMGDTSLGLISIAGAIFITHLAYQNFTTKNEDFAQQESASSSLKKAVVVNVLNPHFYIYWFSIATPTFARASSIESSLFVGGVIFCSFLTMVLMCVGVHRIRMHVFDYIHWILRILGVALLLFALKLLMQGISLLA